jgi:hypothetical protein
MDPHAGALIFNDATGAVIDVNLQGSTEDVRQRLTRQEAQAAPEPRGPGRPKLGVVAREVTLLPRHWDWLNAQPGGASVALRKLIEEARRTGGGADQVRLAQEAAQRFMTAMAGDRPGYEEATRALYARQAERFLQITEAWPADIRAHARKLAQPAFAGAAAA